MVQVEGGTVFVLLDSPQEPPGHPAPASRMTRCCCSRGLSTGPLWKADSSISQEYAWPFSGPFSFLSVFFPVVTHKDL